LTGRERERAKFERKIENIETRTRVWGAVDRYRPDLNCGDLSRKGGDSPNNKEKGGVALAGQLCEGIVTSISLNIE